VPGVSLDSTEAGGLPLIPRRRNSPTRNDERASGLIAVSSTNLSGDAAEALRLAETEPERAVLLAARTSRQARREGAWAVAAVAERAWGLALRHRGDLDSAIRHLREAVRLGERAGAPAVAAQARMTLAFALTERGRSRQALAEIDA